MNDLTKKKNMLRLAVYGTGAYVAYSAKSPTVRYGAIGAIIIAIFLQNKGMGQG